MARDQRKSFGVLLWENTLQAFETLRDRRFRSFLTVLGVFIGVVIIIGVASVLNGFRKRVVDSVQQFGTNNIFVTRLPMIQMARPSAEVRKRRNLTLEDAWAIRDECPALAAVSPVQWLFFSQATAKYNGKEMLGPTLRGVFPEMSEVMTLDLAEGRFFTAEENRRRERVCAIGASVVDTLFPRQSALDKEIVVEGTRLRVVGVMLKFREAPFGGENPQDSLIFIPYYAFREMFPPLKDHIIAARAKVGRLDEAIEQIEETLRRRRAVPWSKPDDFEIATSTSMIETFDKIVFAALAVMFALSTVAFLVGGVGVMNVMLASVKERTREIGVRRAIGARRCDITWQFLTEAVAMTGAGGALGVAAGETLVWALKTFLPALPCATPLWARLFGFFGSVTVGLVFGLWPAIAAARLDPIRALRYE